MPADTGRPHTAALPPPPQAVQPPPPAARVAQSVQATPVAQQNPPPLATVPTALDPNGLVGALGPDAHSDDLFGAMMAMTMLLRPDDMVMGAVRCVVDASPAVFARVQDRLLVTSSRRYAPQWAIFAVGAVAARTTPQVDGTTEVRIASVGAATVVSGVTDPGSLVTMLLDTPLSPAP